MSNKEINRQDVVALLQLCKVGGDVDLDGIVWRESLIHLGITHGVGAWCYYRIKNNRLEQNIPEYLLKLWKNTYIQTSLVNQQKIKVYGKIQQLFKEAGIPVLALKGIALAFVVYPDEGVRPMGDIDILVPEGEGMRALNILLKQGAKPCYEPRSALHEHVHAHVRAVMFFGVMVEIHQRLFALGNPFNLNNDLFHSARLLERNGQKIKLLDEASMGYHLAAHAAYGLKMGGMRFGWLVDIAMFIENIKDKTAFRNEILECNPKNKGEIADILNMAALMNSSVDSDIIQNKSRLIDSIYEGIEKKNIEKRHRIINLHEIAQTPGLLRKLKLFYKEFFPDESYMREKYGDGRSGLIGLYVRRFIGR